MSVEVRGECVLDLPAARLRGLVGVEYIVPASVNTHVGVEDARAYVAYSRDKLSGGGDDELAVDALRQLSALEEDCPELDEIECTQEELRKFAQACTAYVHAKLQRDGTYAQQMELRDVVVGLGDVYVRLCDAERETREAFEASEDGKRVAELEQLIDRAEKRLRALSVQLDENGDLRIVSKKQKKLARIAPEKLAASALKIRGLVKTISGEVDGLRAERDALCAASEAYAAWRAALAALHDAEEEHGITRLRSEVEQRTAKVSTILTARGPDFEQQCASLVRSEVADLQAEAARDETLARLLEEHPDGRLEILTNFQAPGTVSELDGLLCFVSSDDEVLGVLRVYEMKVNPHVIKHSFFTRKTMLDFLTGRIDVVSKVFRSGQFTGCSVRDQVLKRRFKFTPESWAPIREAYDDDVAAADPLAAALDFPWSRVVFFVRPRPIPNVSSSQLQFLASAAVDPASGLDIFHLERNQLLLRRLFASMIVRCLRSPQTDLLLDLYVRLGYGSNIRVVLYDNNGSSP